MNTIKGKILHIFINDYFSYEALLKVVTGIPKNAEMLENFEGCNFYHTKNEAIRMFNQYEIAGKKFRHFYYVKYQHTNSKGETYPVWELYEIIED